MRPDRVVQRVSLVDKQHAVQRFLNFGICLDRSLAEILRHQSRPICFDHVPAFEDAVALENPSQDTCHRRLARSRVAIEDEMKRLAVYREVGSVPLRLDIEKCFEPLNLTLDALKADHGG